MKSLTFSNLIYALNLYCAQSCSERQNLLEVARTAKKLLQTPKVAQKLPSKTGKGLLRVNVFIRALDDLLYKEKNERSLNRQECTVY